ncbi:hypothetical protein Dimus_010551 [Dionaea muscipula]
MLNPAVSACTTIDTGTRPAVVVKVLSEEATLFGGVTGSVILWEYGYMTKVNEKIDVYSFGVVLLELATGKEANSRNENQNLAE